MRLRFSRAHLFLAFVSFIIVIYAEWIYPAKAFDECIWPLGPTAKHVAMIADPQIVDNNTYPGRFKPFLWITEYIADRFMARNFRMLHRRLRPDAVFFLGDYFDGGREWEDAAWEREYKRYMGVFPPSSKVPHFMNVPGNHDVGSAETTVPSAYERFRAHFNDPSQVQTIGEYSIVSVDTNALMDAENEKIYRPAKEFLEVIKENRADYEPIIVLSHIPLYRPPLSYCGFEREGRPIEWTKGHQYITEVTPEISQDILFGLKPTYVFSGDDHDACKHTHQWAITEQTEEYTVKSFSMCSGIRRPGFQLLSLDTRKRHATDSCLVGKPFMPIQIQLIAYGLLILLSAAFTIVLRGPDSYSELPVSEAQKKTVHAGSRFSKKRALIRDVAVGLIPASIAWIFGQLLVHVWSFSRRI